MVVLAIAYYSGGADNGGLLGYVHFCATSGLFGYVHFCTLFDPKDIMELEKWAKYTYRAF